MHPSFARKFLPSLLCGAGTLGTALAQDAADPRTASLEEIVVSATKRGEVNVQDVPLAIQALNGEALEAVGAVDFEDYFRSVAGLSVYDQGSGDKRYIMRGVNAAGAGTVGLYIDEVIITGENAQDGGGRQPDVRLFDIDRIEVLKGPQGTTFGSSSLAGTIRFITRKPELGAFEGYVQGGGEHIDGGDVGWQAQGALNVPLGERAAVRAAGFYQQGAGYIDNAFRDEANGSEVTGARLLARFEPTEALRVSLMAMLQDVRREGPPYFNRIDYLGNALSPGDDYTQAEIVDTGFDDDMQLYNGTVEYDTPIGQLAATASRMERDTVFERDSSLVMQRFVGRPAFGTGRSAIIQPKDTTLDAFELRLASTSEGRVGYLVGLFHQDEDRFFRSVIYPAPAGQIIPTPNYSLERTIETSIAEYAAFGELAFDLTDALTLTLGTRYYDFDIEEIANNISVFSGMAGTGFGPRFTFGEDGAIFRGNLAWKLAEDQLLYLQAAEGFRPGGTNDQVAALIAGVTIPQGFGSDSLVNYELGYKASALDQRLQWSAAAFLIDWDDIQLQAEAVGGGGRFPYRTNGGGAEVRGVELALTARPRERLELALTAALTDAALSEDNPLPQSGLDGDEIPYVPDFAASLTSRYDWSVGALTAHIGGDLSYVSSRTTEYRPTNTLFRELESYALLSLRAGLASEAAGWSATLAVENVTDDDSQIDVFRIVGGLYPDGFIINRPRAVSLSFRKSFR